MSLLDVQNLTVSFDGKPVVNGISFQIQPGEKLALVGESGSGKTISALSLLRLVADAQTTGKAFFGGHDLLALSEHALRGINAAGGTNAVRWPLETVMATGDKAVGVPVLTELYAAMSASPHPVDLLALFKSLGVEVSHGHARFDDKAPLADIRRAITRGTD